MTSFGSYLTDARKKAGLSQKDLASRLFKGEDGEPISPQYLNDIERDRRNPPSDHIINQIAETLNLSADYIQYLAGRLPGDLQNIRDTQKVESALKAFRKAMRDD